MVPVWEVFERLMVNYDYSFFAESWSNTIVDMICDIGGIILGFYIVRYWLLNHKAKN